MTTRGGRMVSINTTQPPAPIPPMFYMILFMAIVSVPFMVWLLFYSRRLSTWIRAFIAMAVVLGLVFAGLYAGTNLVMQQTGVIRVPVNVTVDGVPVNATVELPYYTPARYAGAAALVVYAAALIDMLIVFVWLIGEAFNNLVSILGGGSRRWKP